MKTTKKILTVSALLLSFTVSAQQDIHYSQFYSPQLIINPASAGMLNGQVRFMGNYRSQWSSIGTPFTTISGSVDTRLFEGKMKNSFIGTGITFYNDKAGDSKLTTGNYTFNLSYALEVAENFYLSLGVQPGFIQKSISYSGLYFENQFNGIGFDQSAASYEPTASTSYSTFDIGAGMYGVYRIDDRTSIYAGIAGMHLTSPNISFSGGTDNLYRKFTFHGGAEIGIKNTHLTVLPNTLMKFQGPNKIINFGTDLKYIFQEQSHFTGFVNELSMSLGAYYRVGDAFWGVFQFSWTGLTLSFSYDMNLSGLSVATNGNGGIEIGLSYRYGVGHGKGKTTRFL